MISATSISPSTRAKSSRLATEQLYDVSNASKKLGLVKPDAGFCVDEKDCSLKSQFLLPSSSSSRQEHCEDRGVLTCRCNYLGAISFPSRRKPAGLHCGRHGSASRKCRRAEACGKVHHCALRHGHHPHDPLPAAEAAQRRPYHACHCCQRLVSLCDELFN